ncbi:MAG: hypothetical protein ACHQD8_07020 [Chitinophagales bacterium]
MSHDPGKNGTCLPPACPAYRQAGGKQGRQVGYFGLVKIADSRRPPNDSWGWDYGC